MFSKWLCALILFALASPTSLHAQPHNPFHGVTRTEIEPFTYCYMSANHVVIEVSTDSDSTFTGHDITLYSRADAKSNPCYPTGRGYRLPPGEDNRYVVGINDRYVLIDYGCCPGPRVLEIYELVSNMRICVAIILMDRCNGKVQPSCFFGKRHLENGKIVRKRVDGSGIRVSDLVSKSSSFLISKRWTLQV